MEYIIKDNEEFSGQIVSAISNGIVKYTNGMTFAEFQASHASPLKIVSAAELDAIIAEYRAKKASAIFNITQQDFEYMLCVLPPARWGQCDGVELFACPEATEMDLHSWFARIGDKYVSFVDRLSGDTSQMAQRVKEFIGAQKV